MENSDMKNPSDFIEMCFSSVLQKTEAEVVAANIMVILVREGNEWKKLDWDTYKEHRTNDGNFSEWKEKPYFEQVLKYTVSEDAARCFGGSWAEIK